MDGLPLDLTTQTKFWRKAKETQTIYGEVVSTTPVMEMLMDLWPLKEYYTKTRFFQPTVLRKTVVGHSGAVSDTSKLVVFTLYLLFT